MARTDTLEHFLTDVADAIRSKGGTQATIDADNFDTAIGALPSGGVAPNYVSFYNAPAGTDISWLTDTSNLTSCNGMFMQAKTTGALDISSWDLSSCRDITAIFNGSYFSSIKFPGGNIPATDVMNVIDYTTNLTNFEFGSNCVFTELTSARYMFKNYSTSALTNLDFNGASFPKLINFEGMFQGQSALTTLTLPTFGATNVTSLASMFNNCSSLVTINNLFPTAKTAASRISLGDMFTYCRALTGVINLSTITATCSALSRAFNECGNVTEINLSNLSSIANINMTNAFYKCTSLQKLDVRNMTMYSVTGTNIFGDESDSTTCVPNNCEIIVQDANSKSWFTSNYPRFTNVKTVAEL